ncbi:MAG: hypothetical protein STHCBS139747_007722 [Sporothrix thermara]
MADEIRLEHSVADHVEASPEETILDEPLLETGAAEKQAEFLHKDTQGDAKVVSEAAARAVVSEMNEKNTTGSHIDIFKAEENHGQDYDHDHDQHMATDEDGDVDAEREADYDAVFSDHSPRSSVGSFEHNSGASSNGASEDQRKKDFVNLADKAHRMESEYEHDYVDETGSVAYHGHGGRDSRNSRHRSPRLSGVSGMSHMSQYEQHREQDEIHYDDDEEFAPQTIRGTPRMAFRTPSSVRALQMSSPSPSVIFGVSPRSAARRRRIGTGGGLDDGQSMGSVGTYSSLPSSPSKNHTPTRFKVVHKPEPAPLVLLHATLMPTRWAWSDVLRTLDERLSSTARTSIKEDAAFPGDGKLTASTFEPSAALRRLHGAWCQLQEYSFGADTVAERGVLLPHPQSDYEVLEERLLEALELPVRRRARILECGHYLGPADEYDDVNDDDDDDDDNDDNDDNDFDGEDDDHYSGRSSYRDGGGSPDKRRWCATCHSDIRYESLGAERVFRVKVYASNGLMTVGAWAACWSEMERVDVEIEPIVADAALLRELNQLRTLQQKEAVHRQREEQDAAVAVKPVHAAAAVVAAELEFQDGQNNMHDGTDGFPYEYEDKDHANSIPRSKETAQSPATADHFHRSSLGAMSASLPVRDSPLEHATITTADRVPDIDRRQREAEERLREIYGQAPPSFPGAEASERREENFVRDQQPLAADRSFHDDAARHAAGHAASSSSDSAAHSRKPQPQTPYDSASLPELLLAAGRVFVSDRKHVAIAVLSIIVILLATVRVPPGAGVAGVSAAVPGGFVASTQSQVLDAHPGVDQRLPRPRDGGVEAAQKPAAAAAGLVMDEIAEAAKSMEVLVETVVEKMTVKVYETVTETATATSTPTSAQASVSTETSEAAAAVEDLAATTIESLESFESTEAIEPSDTTAVEPAPVSANKNAESLFAATCAKSFAAEPTPAAADANVSGKL